MARAGPKTFSCSRFLTNWGYVCDLLFGGSGSRRMRESNTTVLLNPFLEGMREAGASVDLHYLEGMDITACLGDVRYPSAYNRMTWIIFTRILRKLISWF